MTTRHDALIARMTAQRTRWEQAHDRRAIFLACYTLMTSNMARAVAAGRFRDAAWVTVLIDAFADYYFVALAAYEGQPGPLPQVWRHAHDLAAAPTTPVIQSLLMGVNAHINCDLVLVLDDLLAPGWATLDATGRADRYHDYCLVNTIIGETIDVVQAQVIAPSARLMGVVDHLCGPLDEWCTARLIRNWREDVWRRALAIIETADAGRREELRRETDMIALRRIALVVEGGALGARVFGYPLRHLRRLRLL